jgi:hypothetical protein
MEFENFVAYKYVRLSTDEFRFVKAFGSIIHKDLVQEGEIAISAGLISIYPDKFSVIDTGSMTLKIYSSRPDDNTFIEKLTGKKWENPSF